MVVLYDADLCTINPHTTKMFLDNELQVDSVIRIFQITESNRKTRNGRHNAANSVN